MLVCQYQDKNEHFFRFRGIPKSPTFSLATFQPQITALPKDLTMRPSTLWEVRNPDSHLTLSLSGEKKQQPCFFTTKKISMANLLADPDSPQLAINNPLSTRNPAFFQPEHVFVLSPNLPHLVLNSCNSFFPGLWHHLVSSLKPGLTTVFLRVEFETEVIFVSFFFGRKFPAGFLQNYTRPWNSHISPGWCIFKRVAAHLKKQQRPKIPPSWFQPFKGDGFGLVVGDSTPLIGKRCGWKQTHGYRFWKENMETHRKKVGRSPQWDAGIHSLCPHLFFLKLETPLPACHPPKQNLQRSPIFQRWCLQYL